MDHTSSSCSNKNDDEVDDGRQSPRQRRRRRASLQTAFFSMATTSRYFRSQNFKPCKIIGVLYLDDPNPSPSKLRAHTIDKLVTKFPRFASFVTLEENPQTKERTVWFNQLEKEEIDMEYHFTIIDGQGIFTEESDISELVSESHLMDWDISKPLWRLTLVTNMKDGRSLLFFVVDHTVGDGASMAAIMSSLFDNNRIDEEDAGSDDDPTLPKKKKEHTKTSAAATTKSSIHVRLSHRITTLLYAFYMGIIGLLILPPDPDNCFKFPINKRRSKAIGRKCSQTKQFPLQEIKDIKNCLPGTTVNDVVTAIVTIAMRRYFNEKTYKKADKSSCIHNNIHLTCTINYRPPDTTLEDLIEEGGSNRVVTGTFHVPLHYESPIDAVWQCKSRMDVYKTTPLTKIAFKVANFLLRTLPWSELEKKGSDAFFNFSGVISNVMGPAYKASIGGYTINDFAFYGVASGQGTYVGILSYNDRVRMFVCMDKHVDADPQDFKDCLENAYNELKLATVTSSSSELLPPDVTTTSARVLEFGFWIGLSFLCFWSIPGWYTPALVYGLLGFLILRRTRSSRGTPH